MKILKTDIKGKPVSIKFDETTTSQVKKQFDGYLTYFCEKSACVVTSYCGSLLARAIYEKGGKIIINFLNSYKGSYGPKSSGNERILIT